MNSKNRWDVNKQADSLVRHFIDNQVKVNRNGLPESYIYKFHHDGPYKDYDGFNISINKIMPQIGRFTNVIHKIFY